LALAFILLVAVYFHFLVAPLYPSEGAGLWGSRLLHYAGPACFLLWWLLALPHGTLRYGQLPKMLVPGVIYIAWVMGRGAVVNDYPYAIFDPRPGGYAVVAMGVAAVASAVAFVGALLILIDHLLGRNRKAA
jgi:hypothetical protein